MASPNKDTEVEESVSGVPEQWPLFDAPVLSSVRVTGFTERNGTTYFSVCAVLEGFQWTVLKTYDQFLALHKVLVSEYGVDKSLMPGKGVLGFFTQPKKAQLVELQTKLENMLMTVVKNCPVAPTELFKFLEYPFCDILSVTQGLARFFYQQGEVVIAQDKAVQISPLQLHCINRRLILPIASSETGRMKDDFGHLLDFIQNLKKLKISPPTEEAFMVRGAEQLTFDLSLMKSIEVLFIESISIRQFQGRHQLPGQLVALEVRRTVNSLKDMLVVYPPTDVEHYVEPSMFEAPPNLIPLAAPAKPITPSSSVPDFTKALKWEHLKQANFKLNQLKKIDTSLQLIPFLEKLDLSYNYIEEVENLTDLPHLRVLDLSHNKIVNLTDLHRRMGNIKKLSLASNQISYLEGFQRAFSLEYIDLSNNHISDVSEVSKLAGLPNLNYLRLSGNQIEQSPSYRSQVFSNLPHTDEQVALDGKKASIDEHYISISLNTPTLGHKRVPSRTADISLDVDEQETKEAQTELEDGMSLTNQLEELRKEGGDRWLAIFNAEKRNGPKATADDDDVVMSKSSKKKRKTGRHHRHKKGGAKRSLDSSLDMEASLADLEVSLSASLAELVTTKQAELSDSTSTNFQVTVHEYTGSLQSLSTEDMDQLLLNCRLEECSVSVDRSLNRILEVIVAANRTRAQRDLALLTDLKVHEGKRLALCIQFSSFGTSSVWVVYCVQTLNSLAKLYAAVRSAMRSRSTTPEASLALLDITSIVQPVASSDTHVPQLEVQESIDGNHVSSETTLTLSDIKDGVPTSSLDSEQVSSKADSVSSSTTPNRSPSPSLSSSKQNGSQLLDSYSPTKPLSSSSTPTTRRSPIHMEEQRSETLDSTFQYTQEVQRDLEDESAIASAVAISQSSRDFTESIDVVERQRQDSLSSSKSLPPKVIKKPGLENESLSSFFRGVIAQDCNEMIVSVVWGGCNMSSSPSCEVEVGLIVSDRAVYLLEVLDPEKHRKRHLSWDTDSLPLALLVASPLATLVRVSTGLYDQSVRVEFIEKGLVKSFALLPRTYDQMVAITENVKAVLDASKIEHVVISTQEAIVSPRQIDGVVFITSDTSDLVKLKEDLVWPKTIAQVGNFMAVTSKSETVLSSHFETEVKRISEDLAHKFEIVQHVIVGEISTDTLPVSIGQPHLKTRALILTGDSVYLCRESLVSWPRDSAAPIKIPFPRAAVLDSHPLKSVSKIKICDKAQSVVAYTDPVYEFVIKFEVSDEGPATDKSVFKWKLCVQDREYLDQFITCLTHLWNDLRQSDLKVIHTTDSITDVLSLQPLSKSSRPSTKRSTSVTSGGSSRNPNSGFYRSQVLLDFASLSNYQRLKFFKRHVAQAEFMKSDEVPFGTFLAHCSCTSPTQGHIEIEVCVLTSNYAIYFLSDVDCIRKWLDDGGAFSFQRMSLLSKKDSAEVRCFHRIWLSEVKEIKLGLFYLSTSIASVQAKTGSPNTVITIHTDNQFTTVSFLGSLSCTLNLRDSAEEEELSDLLSDYCDLVSESLSIQKVKKGSKFNVECIPHPDIDIDKLKEILISISPSITRNSSIENVAMSMHILCAQVMLLVEELHIRDTVSIQARPHLVQLTNYGLYVCRNSKDEYFSPSVAAPSDLRVKKWCHIDLIEQVIVKQPVPPTFANHTLQISLRTPQASVPSKDGLCFIVQNGELLRYFVHLLSNLWSVRTGKHLPINIH